VLDIAIHKLFMYISLLLNEEELPAQSKDHDLSLNNDMI